MESETDQRETVFISTDEVFISTDERYDGPDKIMNDV